MSNDVVISVENLWKQYRYGVLSHRTLHKDLQSWWARVRGKEDPNSRIGGEHGAKRKATNSMPSAPCSMQSVGGAMPHALCAMPDDDRFYALQDINFEVKQGEILGIIGKNGAGKSTLLKIMSKVTTPTRGQIKIKGRVASLLEVGTGFHPELTGRENIFLNGAILGMSKAEIRKKFDEIVAFAEIEKFIDTPVKRYSSGMYVRLAFAVAAHLEPEILLVDEVLAVGDAAFQKKCLGKMEDVAREGRTVLFVSHNMGAINALCYKALLLDGGNLVYEGKTQDVVNSYLKRTANKSIERGRIEYQDDLLAPIQIKHIAIKNETDEITRVIRYQESFYLELGIIIRQKTSYYYATIVLYDSFGHLVVFTADDDIKESQLSNKESGEYTYKAKYHSRFLIPGEYFVEINLCEQNKGRIDTQNAKLSFEIQDQFSRRGIRGKYRPAIVAPEVNWELTT